MRVRERGGGEKYSTVGRRDTAGGEKERRERWRRRDRSLQQRILLLRLLLQQLVLRTPQLIWKEVGIWIIRDWIISTATQNPTMPWSVPSILPQTSPPCFWRSKQSKGVGCSGDMTRQNLQNQHKLALCVLVGFSNSKTHLTSHIRCYKYLFQLNTTDFEKNVDITVIIDASDGSVCTGHVSRRNVSVASPSISVSQTTSPSTTWMGSMIP